MPIVKIGFTKINVERKGHVKGQIQISNNFVLNSLEKVNSKFTSHESIKISFDFNTKFEPKVGTISLSGEAILLEPSKKAEEILAVWKKDKKLADDIVAPVMNNILSKCNIEAILLGKEVGLPPTVKMPRVKVK